MNNILGGKKSMDCFSFNVDTWYIIITVFFHLFLCWIQLLTSAKSTILVLFKYKTIQYSLTLSHTACKVFIGKQPKEQLTLTQDYVLETLPRTLHALCHLILRTTQLGTMIIPSFTNEETERLSSFPRVTLPRKMVEPSF